MNLDAVRRWTLALFIVLFPLYALPSGLPQPSHWLIAVACALSARPLLGMLKTPDREVLLPLLLFVGYTVVVNGYYSMAYPTAALGDLPLRRSLQYAFSCGVFSVFLLQFRRGGPGELRFFVACLFLTVIALAVLSVWLPVQPSGRMAAYFNNPNQLAYFALTSLVIGFAFALRVGVSVPLMTLLVLSCLYLIAGSLSFAAGAAVLLLCLLVVAWTLRTRRSMALVLALSLAAFCALALLSPRRGPTASFEAWAQRFEYLVSNFSSHRGFGRLFAHPEYFVLGAGQGAMERFESDNEVHSTVGAIAFSYGIPGVLLFALFIRNLARRDWIRSLILLAPLFTYGMAHNGLRFSAFWLCLSVIYYTGDTPRSGDDVPPLTFRPARFRPARTTGP